MTKISILGCGWLGSPLAKALIKNGFTVKGSTTSVDKISLLENSGIQAFLIALTAEEIQGNIVGFLENSEILIIDIPPKLKGIEKGSFVQKIKKLIPFIEKSAIEKIIFVSATSVYRDDNSIVTEDTTPQPDTESGKQLLQTEQLLLNNTNFKTTVLRFGGLIGENRHPVHFLAGRKNIENPEAPINLIDQVDCIDLIIKLIDHTEPDEVWNETFNAVSTFHPTREEYYTQKAIEFHLALPEFNHSKPSMGKTISSEKLIRVLDYDFKVPNL